MTTTDIKTFNELRDFERKMVIAYVCDFIQYDHDKYTQILDLLLSWESETPTDSKFAWTLSEVITKTPQ